MKIDFIGTGMMGCLKRGNSSILLNDEILFDIGSGVLLKLKEMEKDISKIKYLIVSHFHADHFLDIANFLLRRYIRKEEGLLTIVGPKGIRKMTIALMTLTHGDNDPNKYDNIEEKYHLKFVELEDESICFDHMKLTAYSLVHGTCTPCNGYVLELEDKTIGYTGDTTECENLETLISNSDFVLIDATLMKTTPAHIGVSKIFEYASLYEYKNFYFIHRGDQIEKVNKNNLFFPLDGEMTTI